MKEKNRTENDMDTKRPDLPAAFEEKMKLLLGGEYESYVQCFERPRHYGLRVNTAKISAEQFLRIAPWPLTPIPWIANGFTYDGEQFQPAKHPYYHAGLYYLQEPSAMTPADRLFIEPGDRVLDICAAPGGKATELGAKLRGEGILIANDISASRARGLLKNLELAGVGNMMVVNEEPGKLSRYFPEYFDKILIDAPCSGEGMFRKEKKMIRAWEEHGPDFFSKLQKSIVLQAASMLRPGGLLLYSTCTFDPMENERVIEHLLLNCPEFKICEIRPYKGFSGGRPELTEGRLPDMGRTVRIFPHKMDGEGHYLALLKKDGDRQKTIVGPPKNKNGKKLPEALEGFLGLVSHRFDRDRFDIREERVYYMPDDLPDLRGIRFLRSGLLLGGLKKDRFEPSQALAMFLKKEEFANVLDFSAADERVIRYLKGETLLAEDLLSPSDTGWYLVCVDGFPLGFGKAARQVLKNKYLPGWRWQS